ncbi:MAG: alpha-amylase family glycosyl hydrolase [Planctomycetota bacterium]
MMHARLIVVALMGLVCGACTSVQRPETSASTIYEVNVRQYTEAGTFDAFRSHLPRLADLGVEILWLMPIHPIGEEQRKGTLGSYYSVQDFKGINPEFGDEASFQALVDAAHAHGMLVILDWVANHTAWDNTWTITHPERFTRDDGGRLVPPVREWSDVVDLDYDAPGTVEAMRDAMRYWVETYGVDGFRCDVAEMVPQGFWEDTIPVLRKAGATFMLAEGHSDWLYDVGFDATYSWAVPDAVLRAASGEDDATGVRRAIEEDLLALKQRTDGLGTRMLFTTNHDWNSWNGVALERLGPAWPGATVLTFMAPGVPLLYSGQEAGLDAQLAFFEKDEIEWRRHEAAVLYRQLIHLKRSEEALRHGASAGSTELLGLGADDQVIALRRMSGTSDVLALVNLSPRSTSIDAVPVDPDAVYIDLDGFPAKPPTWLGPWDWVVLRRVPASAGE